MWIDSECPEMQKVPEVNDVMRPFDRLLLIRSLRRDRMMYATAAFISSTNTLERKEYVTGIVEDIPFRSHSHHRLSVLISALCLGG